jgi:iron only hydrogenase large subunit-like protein
MGAESTALHEAQDLKDRLGKGENFMTTSCCTAYNNLVSKHISEVSPSLHNNLVSKQGFLVFISPCLAKYEKVFGNENVDYSLSFGEIDALIEAFSNLVVKCGEEKSQYN